MTVASAADTNDTDIYSASEDENAVQEAPEEDILQSSENVASSENESAYLVLDNDADIENIHIGEFIKWIVSVENKGPDTAKNVKVYDKLPDGLKYIKHSTTKGTFNPKTGIWAIGNLSVADGEVFLYITTKALTLGEKINKANLTSDTFNLNANESYEEEEIDVVERADDDDSDDSDISLQDYKTGNPMAILLLSLVGFALPFKKIRR